MHREPAHFRKFLACFLGRQWRNEPYPKIFPIAPSPHFRSIISLPHPAELLGWIYKHGWPMDIFHVMKTTIDPCLGMVSTYHQKWWWLGDGKNGIVLPHLGMGWTLADSAGPGKQTRGPRCFASPQPGPPATFVGKPSTVLGLMGLMGIWGDGDMAYSQQYGDVWLGCFAPPPLYPPPPPPPHHHHHHHHHHFCQRLLLIALVATVAAAVDHHSKWCPSRATGWGNSVSKSAGPEETAADPRGASLSLRRAGDASPRLVSNCTFCLKTSGPKSICNQRTVPIGLYMSPMVTCSSNDISWRLPSLKTTRTSSVAVSIQYISQYHPVSARVEKLRLCIEEVTPQNSDKLITINIGNHPINKLGV